MIKKGEIKKMVRGIETDSKHKQKKKGFCCGNYIIKGRTELLNMVLKVFLKL